MFSLLLGSGLSRATGVPPGWEVTLELVGRLVALETEKPADLAAWFQARHGSASNYSELLDAVAAEPAERRAIIHRVIEGEGEKPRQPTRAHRAIADLVASGSIRVIVTTNFDRLMEKALQDRGIEPTIVASADAIAGAVPLVHARCTIIKVHGDYLDARILNTSDELAAYPKALDRLLDQVFDEFGLIVAGWSGEWDRANNGNTGKGWQCALLRETTNRQ